jgi:putative intracellular protease/amidase
VLFPGGLLGFADMTSVRFLIVWCCALSWACAAEDTQPVRRVLMVVTSHAVLGDTGRPTGYWLPELAHPYHTFAEAGFAVDIASPQGGRAPVDPGSVPDPAGSDTVALAFVADETAQAAMATTTALAAVDPTAYQAVVVVGGNGAMFDLAGNAEAQRIIAGVWNQGGVVAALCHGSAALLDVTLPDGRLLIAGQVITGFSNAEEDIVQRGFDHDFLPFRIETEVPKRGAQFRCGPPFRSFIHIAGGGRLITGQQNLSGLELGQAVVLALQVVP